LNGFMLRTESEHDCYGAGHAGTALSALWAWPWRETNKAGPNTWWRSRAMPRLLGITFEALNNIAIIRKAAGHPE